MRVGGWSVGWLVGWLGGGGGGGGGRGGEISVSTLGRVFYLSQSKALCSKGKPHTHLLSLAKIQCAAINRQ